MPNIFPHRVALVTGASRGIGRAVAARLAQEGLAVAVNYLRSADAAAEAVAQIERAGGNAVALQGDVGRLEDHRDMLDRIVARWGRLDVLVNNAGISSPGRNDVLDVTPAGWDAVMATDLRGPFFLAQQAAREMQRLRGERIVSRGTIVNITSISAYAVSTNRADYCIAKAGLRAMTQILAARLAGDDILVYEVCPGVIATDMTAAVREEYDRRIAAGMLPQPRWGTPDDVAAAVAMLCAGTLPYSTGQCIHVDGGFHVRRL